MLSGLFKNKKQTIFQLTPDQDEFLGGASEEYNLKLVEMERKFNISKLGFNYDQETMVLKLIDGEKVLYEGSAQIIGSFFPSHGTWEWAWNNPNVEKKVALDSLRVKKYGEEQGLDYLSTGIVKLLGDEVFATYLTAVGLKLSSADYAYRCSAGNVVIYLLVSNLQPIIDN